MYSFKIQPTFRLTLDESADVTAGKLKSILSRQEFEGLVKVAGRCAEFQIARDEQRFWSPHLSIQLGDTDNGGELFGRFSPRPEILTMVWAIYFVSAILMLGSAIYGYTQWSLGQPPWSLTVIPVAAVIILSLHIAGMIGQNLSADQILLLRSRLDQAIQLLGEPASRDLETTEELPSNLVQ